MSNTPHVPMDDAHLKQYAANAARELKLEGAVSCRALSRELKAGLKRVRRTQEALNLWSAGQTTVPGAVEWLLDNHYLAARAGEEARRTLKSGRPLRGDGAGEPLLWACARSALWAVPGLDTARLALFLQGFQSVLPLTERELSLLVSALAGVVVERLSALCGDPSALQKGRVAPEEMAKIFTALRALEGAGWSRLLEEASQVEGILAQDPTGHYPGMDGDTRRRYRQRPPGGGGGAPPPPPPPGGGRGGPEGPYGRGRRRPPGPGAGPQGGPPYRMVPLPGAPGPA